MNPRDASRAAPGRHAPLAMSAETFRRLGHQIVDQLADGLASIPARPVTPNDLPAAVRDAFATGGSLPEAGTDPAVLLATLAPRLFERSLFNAHPRFFGYITAPPAPIGVLGDFIASALNANCGSWTLSPAATCSGSVRSPSAGFRPTGISAWISPRLRAASTRMARPGRCRSS
jgi:hypothetical protein